MSRSFVTVDLNRLRQNFQLISGRLTGGASLLVMVKGNAYGHGLIPVALALSDAQAFGVATLDEAIALRQAGILAQIVVMSGFVSDDELALLIKYKLATVVHAQYQVNLLVRASVSCPIPVWLKYDSGMNRLGLNEQEFCWAYQQLNASSSIAKPLVLMTHFASADDVDSSFTQQQIKKFEQVTMGMTNPKSLCNSAGVVAYQHAQQDWVRMGGLLYGISPSPNLHPYQIGLKPVMSFYSVLLVVKWVEQGGYVGYGNLWRCEKRTRIGIVSAGYADGYPRQVGEAAQVLLNGIHCRVLGMVSMDFLAIDVTNIQAEVGDKVILWGDGLPVEQVASDSSTIAYELTTQVAQRVSRKYIGAYIKHNLGSV